MNEIGSKDFQERFLKANANLQFIAAEFADVLRDLMRAAASDDPSSQAYRAAQKMNFVAELLSRCEEKFGFGPLFETALKEFEVSADDMTVEGARLHAAQRGIKYFVESSCRDNAARGRASRRADEFMSAIKWIDETREFNLRKHRGG